MQSVLPPASSFQSLVIPTSTSPPETTAAASIQDQIIYLTLLASYQRAFAANPALGDQLLALTGGAPQEAIDPFAAVGSSDFLAPAVKIQAPPSPPRSPDGACGTVSPDALMWKHEDEEAYEATEAAEEPDDAGRRLSASPPPVPIMKSPSGSVGIGLMDFEDYVRQVETEMDGGENQGENAPLGGGAVRGKGAQGKSSRSRRAPLSPAEITQRRDKNLQAARRCRLRKALRVRWLEARCEELERENTKIEERIADLERRLSERESRA